MFIRWAAAAGDAAASGSGVAMEDDMLM
jgi:hypothetical protein